MKKLGTAAYAEYHAYLLRLWQEIPGSAWRISLQEATTGEGHLFADLEGLHAFLQRTMADANQLAESVADQV